MTSFAIPELDRRAMIRAAVAAPSIHNTQPWLFRFRGGTLEVYRDPERELPVEDPVRRMLCMSLGAAIMNVRVVAAAREYGSQVHVIADQQRPDLVAVVELAGQAAAPLAVLTPAIYRRQTNREPYSNERVPAGLRRRLELSAGAESTQLHWLERPSCRWWLHLATNESMAVNDADSELMAERRRWVGGERDVDGVPSRSLGPHMAFPVVRSGAPRVVGTSPRVAGVAPRISARTTRVAAGIARHVAVFEREPQLAVLVTRRDDLREWLRAGQAMELVLLQATVHGVATALLNQVLEHPALRWQIDDASGPWRFPQALIRFGYAPPVPPTPRRPVDAVLLPDR